MDNWTGEPSILGPSTKSDPYPLPRMGVLMDGAIKTSGLIFGRVTSKGIYSYTVVLWVKNVWWFLVGWCSDLEASYSVFTPDLLGTTFQSFAKLN